MRVLVVPDKFKGTLTAQEAASAIAAGWRSERPGDQLELLPMSDGGDGFGAVLGSLLQARKEIVPLINAAHEPHRASYWFDPKTETAIVETAQVVGLAILPRGQFHPFELDTFGVGELLLHLSRGGARKCVAGIGGSATNDAGFGMARALGYFFLLSNGEQITRWTELEKLDRIVPPAKPVHFDSLTIAMDVQNQLLGPNGATRVYGPQKGMRPEDFPLADRCFERLVEVVKRDLQKDCASEPGTGAAGGLGYGLRVFLDGTFEPGFAIFSRLSHLPEKIGNADLVITAEGAIDEQTLMGKGTGAIAAIARSKGKATIGLAGMLKEMEVAPHVQLFNGLAAICPRLAPVEEAMKKAGPLLERLSSETAKHIFSYAPNLRG